MTFKDGQDSFWACRFGTGDIQRNQGQALRILAGRRHLVSDSKTE